MCGCEGTNGAGDADHEGSLGLVVVRVCLGGGTLVHSVCDREAVCASCVCARTCVRDWVCDGVSRDLPIWVRGY